mmetsp:Transcript_41524/g.45073  ORF Transcript_41524/g.45073 Transcript_41524/m.45073 type:complete len:81 (-) Transcript_41524:1308-1550(-)
MGILANGIVDHLQKAGRKESKSGTPRVSLLWKESIVLAVTRNGPILKHHVRNYIYVYISMILPVYLMKEKTAGTLLYVMY